MSIEEQLGSTLRLVEAARAAIARVPLAPQTTADRSAEVLHRLGAVTNELSHVLDGLPPELHYYTLFPTLVPANPEHIPEFLSTRIPAALQQEDAEAEKAAGGRSPEGATSALYTSATTDYVSQLTHLRDRIGVASKRALDRMNKVTHAAREAVVRSSRDPA